MATYSLTNFAVIDGQFILIYDSENQLRHSIIPHETQFYARHFDCVIEVNGISTDKYRVLDFSSVVEATEATTILNNLKHTIQYDINGWEDITNKPNTISGYTIIDAYTKSESDSNFLSASTNFDGRYLSANTFDNQVSYNINTSGNISASTLTINNTYSLPTISGDTNHVLTYNGDGTTSWLPIYYKYEKVLTVIDWVNSSQTLVVSGVTIDNDIFVSAKTKVDQDLWATNDVFCSDQGTNYLTFSCVSYPVSAITLNIKIQN